MKLIFFIVTGVEWVRNSSQLSNRGGWTPVLHDQSTAAGIGRWRAKARPLLGHRVDATLDRVTQTEETPCPAQT